MNDKIIGNGNNADAPARMNGIKSLTGCYCRKCLEEYDDSIGAIGWNRQTFRMMVLCNMCGCKRCPHATDHNLECTGSNDPGQKGSVYE